MDGPKSGRQFSVLKGIPIMPACIRLSANAGFEALKNDMNVWSAGFEVGSREISCQDSIDFLNGRAERWCHSDQGTKYIGEAPNERIVCTYEAHPNHSRKWSSSMPAESFAASCRLSENITNFRVRRFLGNFRHLSRESTGENLTRSLKARAVLPQRRPGSASTKSVSQRGQTEGSAAPRHRLPCIFVPEQHSAPAPPEREQHR